MFCAACFPRTRLPSGAIASCRRSTAADGGAREGDDVPDCDSSRGCICRQRPEHDQVGGEHNQQAPEDGLLAQTRRLPAEIVEATPARGEPIDRPRREAEQAQFFGGRRVDREPIRIVGMTLRLAPASRIGAHHAYAANTNADSSPAAISTSPDAMKSIEMLIGGPLIPRSKSRAIARSVVRRGSSRCPMPEGPTHAIVN